MAQKRLIMNGVHSTAMKVTTEKKKLRKLKAKRKDFNYIREHLVDIDTWLTPEEERILEEGIREFKEGKTIRLEDIERGRCGP